MAFHWLDAERFLCTVIDSSVNATYSMELARNGLHGDTTASDIRKRLDILQRSKVGWGKPTEKRQLDPLEDHGWKLNGNVLAMHQKSLDVLRFIRLPSLTVPVTTSDSEDSWTIPISDIAVYPIFSMDPSQDLLVLLEEIRHTGQLNDDVRNVYRFHLKTMSTGQAHPDANEHIIEVKSKQHSDFIVQHCTQISGDCLGVMLNDTLENNLFICNWKTGVVHLLVQDMANVLQSFAFLSDSRVIVTAVKGFPRIINFLEVDTTILDPTWASIRPFISLSLPIAEESSSCLVTCDTPYSWPNNASSVPFSDDPDQMIYTVILFSSDVHWLFVIPRKTLLGVLQQAKTLPRTVTRTEVPWELWGATGTRLFNPACYFRLSDTWTCLTFGSTMVIFDKNKRFATMYDFNQARVEEEIRKGTKAHMTPHRLPPPTGQGASPVLVCTHPSYMRMPGNVNAKTWLPFRVRSFALPEYTEDERLRAMMCSQHCVIAVIEDEQHGTRFDIISFEL